MTKIGLVYLWCDSTDEEWSAKRKRFQQYDCIEKTAAADCRFINNNELLFSMRSVAKFVPWVNHIYLITDHQIPSWLNVEHPKITLVNHDDILPREVLPTFNSMAIETGIHNIRGLSEHFLLANDDTFFGRKVDPDFFFSKNFPISRMSVPFVNQVDRYSLLIQKCFELVGQKCRIGFEAKPYHNIDAYRKSVYREVYDIFSQETTRTRRNRFRCSDDIMRWCVSLYEVWHNKAPFIVIDNRELSGSVCFSGVKKWLNRIRYRFFPRQAAYYSCLRKIDVDRFFKNPKPCVFCINDDMMTTDEHRERAYELLSRMFPDKCEFEK